MTSREWKRRVRPIHDALYEDLVGNADCGPFDGGCLIFAQALQPVIGGEIHVLVRPCGLDDHAVVWRDGKLWDYDGPAHPTRFIKRFNRNERATCASHRPIAPGDLPSAARDDALASRIATLLRSALEGCGTSP